MNELTNEVLEQKLQSGEAFVVDYYADWCQACNEMMPLVNEIATEQSVPFYKVNIDNQPDLKEKARIKAIPMLMMYKGGRVREFIYGKAEKETIEKKLNMLLK